MKIVYAGSPQFAVLPLKRLLESGAEVVAVVTQPDKPVGRKKVLTPTPVKKFAEEAGIPVYDFPKIREHAAELKAFGADIMMTCAYGQLLTEEVIGAFEKGVWNLHASLLPKFRGASPVQAAILAGEKFTGVSVMKTELALDSGDILLVKRCAIGDMTCGELSQKLSALAAEAAEEAVGLIESGDLRLMVQDCSDGAVSFCKKIKKEDGKIDFSAEAEHTVRLVKAFSPQPAAYCSFNGVLLNILDADFAEDCGKAGEVLAADKSGILVACGKNSVRITVLQPAGGKVMSARDFVNGRKIKAGDRLD